MSIEWDDGSTGFSLTRTSVFGSNPNGQREDVAGSAAAVTVFDVCSFDGTTQQIWPGATYEPLYIGVGVCVERQEDGTLTDVDAASECPPPPLTGGTRTARTDDRRARSRLATAWSADPSTPRWRQIEGSAVLTDLSVSPG